MDESAFRSARDAMTPQPCAFERAMLAGACACRLAARRNIAEREAVACSAPPARGECAALCELLRQKSAFALKLIQVQEPLPHALQMKVECGGLRGLQRVLAAEGAAGAQGQAPPSAGAQEDGTVADVHDLVRACAEKFGGLAQLPYSVIVQSVVAHQSRRRRPKQ